MRACGLLQALCDILMASGVPADVLTETINAVAEVIRGNASNQEFLSNVIAPSTPPRCVESTVILILFPIFIENNTRAFFYRPVIVVLLMSMVNEKQPFLLRCSVLYCLQCFLYKNPIGQAQLVQTLLPQGNEAQQMITTGELDQPISMTNDNDLSNLSIVFQLPLTGQLLCGGLFSLDPLSNWFSAVALSYALVENPEQKEQLLKVLLATNIGKPPVTLMQQCMTLLQQGNKIQCKLGLLMLLCEWTSNCPVAVKTFLGIESSITYLTALLTSHENNDDLQEMLLQSMCAFLIGLCIHFNDNSVQNYTKVSYLRNFFN